MDGIDRQPGRIVGVLVAAGETEDPLREQFAALVAALRGIPRVVEAPGQPIDQPECQSAAASTNCLR